MSSPEAESAIPWKFILVLVAPSDDQLPTDDELSSFNLRLTDNGPPGSELLVTVFNRDEVPLSYRPLTVTEEDPTWERMPQFKDEVNRTFLVLDSRTDSINIYDYAFQLGWQDISKSWFLLIGSDSVLNRNLLDEWASYILSLPYDGPRKLLGPTYIFSGQRVPDYVSKELFSIIKEYHADMADYLNEWLKAGFDEIPPPAEVDYAREVDKRIVDLWLEGRFKDQITRDEIEYVRDLPKEKLKEWILKKAKQVFGTVDVELTREAEKLGTRLNYNTVAISQTPKVTGWAVQTETPAFKLLIWNYGLVSNVPDVDVQAMFLNNGQYRRKVFEAMQATVANFVINNRILGVSDVAKLGGWTNPETYTKIADKLRK